MYVIIIPVGLIISGILWMIRCCCRRNATMNRIQRQESMQNAHASMKNYGYFGSHNEWIGNDIQGQTNNEMKMDNNRSSNLFVDANNEKFKKILV